MSTAPSASSPTEKSLRRAARGSILNLVGSAAGALSTFAIAVTITRLSSPTVAGVFFSASSLFLIAIGVGRLGTNTGLVYFISGARGRGEFGLARSYLRTAAMPVAFVALLTSVVLFLGADSLAGWLSAERTEMFARNLRLMAFMVPFAAAVNIMSSSSQGLGTMKLYAVLEQMSLPSIQLLFIATVLGLGFPSLMPVAWAAAFVPLAVIGWLWWRRLVSRLDDGPATARPAPAGAFWRFTAPRALASLSQIAMQRLDIVLVGALADLRAAAVYAALTRFLVLGQIAGRAFSVSVQPLLGAALARQDLPEARNLYQACTAWLVLGMWPFYLALIALAPWVLLVFGRTYAGGASALTVLCVAMLFATACGMVDIVLNMAGKSVWNLVNVLITFAVFVTLDILFIPQMHVLGAAVAWATAILLGNLLPLIQIQFVPGAHPFGRATLWSMGMALLCFGLAPWMIDQIGLESLTGRIIGLGLGTVGYLTFIIRRSDMLQLPLLARALRVRQASRD